MGRLAGLSYREIVKRRKQLGFEFNRQAAGSHEIRFSPAPRAATQPSRTILAICRKARSEQFSSRPALMLMSS